MKIIKIFIAFMLIGISNQKLNAEYWGDTHYIRVTIKLVNNSFLSGHYKYIFNSAAEEKEFLDTIKVYSQLTNFILTSSGSIFSTISINTGVFRTHLGLISPEDCNIQINKDQIKEIRYKGEEIQNDLGCTYITKMELQDKTYLENFVPIKHEILSPYQSDWYVTFYFNKLDSLVENEVLSIQKHIIDKGLNESSDNYQSLFKKGVIVQVCRTD